MPCLCVYNTSFRIAHCERSKRKLLKADLFHLSKVEDILRKTGTTRHTGTTSYGSRLLWFVFVMLCVSGLYQTKANGRHSTPIFVTSPFRMVKSSEEGVNIVKFWLQGRRVLKHIWCAKSKGLTDSQTRQTWLEEKAPKAPVNPSFILIIQYSWYNTHCIVMNGHHDLRSPCQVPDIFIINLSIITICSRSPSCMSAILKLITTHHCCASGNWAFASRCLCKNTKDRDTQCLIDCSICLIYIYIYLWID